MTNYAIHVILFITSVEEASYMHIPSYRVYNEMISEAASVWYVLANDEKETAILVKGPTPSLKALISGCPFKLIFGKCKSYLCTGAVIADVPDAPIMFSVVQRELEEHNALSRILHERNAPLFLFNEMDICVAWTNISFTEQDAKATLSLIGEISDLYVGPFTPDASHALDCFEYTEAATSNHPNTSQIPCTELIPIVGPWTDIENFFYDSSSSQSLKISDPNEGKSLENTIWAILASVFPQSLYKNATILNGHKKREFTDVFAFYTQGSFLVEAKALSVLSSGFQRVQSRRIAGVQKQVKKAIGQLVGACKDFFDGNEIYAADNTLIEVDRSIPPHCIILINELTPSGNWDEIVDLLIDAMQQTGAFFHLLDLQELIMLLKGSSGHPELFDYNLMQRAKLFVDVKSVFIKTQPPDTHETSQKNAYKLS